MVFPLFDTFFMATAVTTVQAGVAIFQTNDTCAICFGVDTN
jgi:hypothetical protein